jgi:hypothetical protein
MAIEMKSKAKHRVVGNKAPKHAYRTRTGPNCCNGNCAAHPTTAGSGIKYSRRVERRNQSR